MRPILGWAWRFAQAAGRGSAAPPPRVRPPPGGVAPSGAPETGSDISEFKVLTRLGIRLGPTTIECLNGKARRTRREDVQETLRMARTSLWTANSPSGSVDLRSTTKGRLEEKADGRVLVEQSCRNRYVSSTLLVHLLGICGHLILGAKEIERKAGTLARLAMFTEYKKGIIKREDINKKGTHFRKSQSLDLMSPTVMGGNSKAFSTVLERANKYLQSAMGYEIVELMSRTEREQLLSRNGTKGKRAFTSLFDSVSTLLITL